LQSLVVVRIARMQRWALALCLAFLLAGSFVGVRAEEGAEDAAAKKEGDEQAEAAVQVVEVKALESSPYVKTAVVFPDQPSQEFPIGKPINVVLGFTNTGDSYFDITEIAASLHHPQDWSVYIQNYTARAVEYSVAPGEQVSVQYAFMPDPMLEPHTFGLSLHVWYRTLDQNFTNAFFNSSVALVDDTESLDPQLLFTYVGILAVAGLAAFFVYRLTTGGRTKRASRAKQAVEQGTKKVFSEAESQEWLAGTSADLRRRK